MSYCRWSSDDFRSDIYCYEGEDGFRTLVAKIRYDFEGVELPPPVPLESGNAEAWVARHNAVRAILEKLPRRAIGLPSDGEDFIDSTPRECAKTLLRLREEGYNVPQSAIDALLEEQAEIDKDAKGEVTLVEERFYGNTVRRKARSSKA